jgi:hypothetical protein
MTGREGADMSIDTAGLECLEDWGEGTCEGEVEHRMPLSGTGASFPRCEAHWVARLVEEERIREAYAPDSDAAPAWLDEGYAGERWSEDY